MSEFCASCGLEIAGGGTACNQVFLEQVARSSGDFRLGLLQRFMVDVYALQHPDRYCESAKSFAAHLTGLCCAMEFNSAQSVHVAILRWLNGASPVERPVPPAARGQLTIAEIRAAAPDAFETALRRWAASTWAAYEPLHGTARHWIGTALARAGQR